MRGGEGDDVGTHDLTPLYGGVLCVVIVSFKINCLLHNAHTGDAQSLVALCKENKKFYQMLFIDSLREVRMET